MQQHKQAFHLLLEHPILFARAKGDEAREYLHSHYNTVEWIFTARLLVVGFMLVFTAINSGRPQLDQRAFAGWNSGLLGMILVGLGAYGCGVSSQRLGKYWPNVIFAVSLLLLSMLLSSMFIVHRVWDSALLYVHLVDCGFSAWLAYRIMTERLSIKRHGVSRLYRH